MNGFLPRGVFVAKQMEEGAERMKNVFKFDCLKTKEILRFLYRATVASEEEAVFLGFRLGFVPFFDFIA